MEIHERLRIARIGANYATAAEAARRLKVPYGTYSGHENGNRGIKYAELFYYAKVFRTSPLWILTGENQNDSNTIFSELLGYAGKSPDGEVEMFEKEIAKGEIIVPDCLLATCSYIEVNGPYLAGIADEGWILFLDQSYVEPSRINPGSLCIITRADGKTYCGRVYPSAEQGKYDLEGPAMIRQRGIAITDMFEILLIVPTATVKVMRQVAQQLLFALTDQGQQAKSTTATGSAKSV